MQVIANTYATFYIYILQFFPKFANLNTYKNHLNRLFVMRIKQILNILLITLYPYVASAATSNESFQVNELWYNVISEINHTVEVAPFPNVDNASYSNDVSGDVIIPQTINYKGITYTVTAIGKSAFKQQANLNSIILPESITTIEKQAFLSCRKLKSIDIPNSVISIGDSAFMYCTELPTIILPTCLSKIGKRVFSSCWELSTITLSSSIRSIELSAFNECYKLSSIVIPNSVVSIGASAFSCCLALKSIEIPNSVKFIGENAFSSCTNLESASLPNTLSIINYRLFDSCKNLKTIKIPNSVTSIGKFAFHQCSNLTSVEIPNSVISIEEGAFNYCTSLISVELPQYLTEINNLFYKCSKLTSLTIPASITYISSGAFAECNSLRHIYCQLKDPLYMNWALFPYMTHIYGTLYVPLGCKSKYETTQPWLNFHNIKEIEYSTIEEIKQYDIYVTVSGSTIIINGLYDSSIIIIFDHLGKIVYNGTKNRIDGIPSGIYFVKIKDLIFKITV